MNTPVLCSKPDIDPSEYPELCDPAVATAALVLACESLAQISGGEARLWLDRFSNAAQLMSSSVPQHLNQRLITMMLTLIESWEKLQQLAIELPDENLMLFCQLQLDDLQAVLKEWLVEKPE